MRKKILMDVDFRRSLGRDEGWESPTAGAAGWEGPAGEADFQITRAGTLLTPSKGRSVRIEGAGVQTRNGDSIELKFRPLDRTKAFVRLGFTGGMENAGVKLALNSRRVTLSTSEWTRPQPIATARIRIPRRRSHVLRVEKTNCGDGLRTNADIAVYLDGAKVLEARDVDVLPQIGVSVGAGGGRVLLERFVHRGIPSGIPEFLHVGGYQVLNSKSIEKNLASIKRGLVAAAEVGVQLLVTPETSLTGLYPTDPVTKNPGRVAAAERKLQRFIAGLKNAPYVVVGLPIWRSVAGHRLGRTRYNASRVYGPDGAIVATCEKIHSCETQFWHGYRLHEFDIYGVPCSMHICHDARYPDVWTLPVMFGARVILHPANGGTISGSVDAFEKSGRRYTQTSHAFYVYVNGGGGSHICGPQKHDSLIAVSDEARRDQPAFPTVGKPVPCLIHARIRVPNAFGYWPIRSFRASQETAQAYAALYRSLGGKRQAPPR